MTTSRGCSRFVILTRRHAFKVPSPRYGWRLFLRGLLANDSERLWWRNSYPAVRDRLCPVVWALPGGWLVVMRRARIVDEAAWSMPFLGVRGLARERARIYETQGSWDIPAELKCDSWGWLDGKLVAVDYGDAT